MENNLFYSVKFDNFIKYIYLIFLIICYWMWMIHLVKTCFRCNKMRENTQLYMY